MALFLTNSRSFHWKLDLDLATFHIGNINPRPAQTSSAYSSCCSYLCQDVVLWLCLHEEAIVALSSYHAVCSIWIKWGDTPLALLFYHPFRCFQSLSSFPMALGILWRNCRTEISHKTTPAVLSQFHGTPETDSGVHVASGGTFRLTPIHPDEYWRHYIKFCRQYQ